MFLKQIFTWWNQQTLGTFIYTLFKGKLIGKDVFENKYYQSRDGKRWVIYKKEIEASKVPPEWFSWLHFLDNKIPDKDKKKYFWQVEHSENLTGTEKAYKPKGSILSDNKKNIKKYETWNP